MNSQASRTTDGRGRLYDSVVDTIGNTPCIRINRWRRSMCGCT